MPTSYSILKTYISSHTYNNMMNRDGSGDISRNHNIRKQKTLMFDGE